MSKKMNDRELARLEAGRNIWKEIKDGMREIKGGGGKRTQVSPKSEVLAARLNAALTQAEFASLLGVSKRTLEQWEQGRRAPSGAAKTLIRVASLHPKILREVA